MGLVYIDLHLPYKSTFSTGSMFGMYIIYLLIHYKQSTIRKYGLKKRPLPIQIRHEFWETAHHG